MKDGRKPDAILIAGPTASGKSALALRLARQTGGVVVNADSMQVYDGLHVISARPNESEMEDVPHHLYGHRDPAHPYSVGDWMREVAALLPVLRAAGRVPVFTGGTGLYFRALLGGLDVMPAVPDTVRTLWRERMAQEGPLALHAHLASCDPGGAARIRPSDPQRIVRALELFAVRGRSDEVAKSGEPALIDPAKSARIVLAPDRAVLRERIARRFAAMLAAGAMEEAVRFAERPQALSGLAGKAIGLEELLAAHHGSITLDEACARAVTRTRQYAKRQETWFRNQFGPDWQRFADPAAFDAG